jgi:hypothetical protein
LEKRLTYESDGQEKIKKIIMFEDTEEMRELANPVAWQIIKLLSREPMYPAQIAKQLKMYEQSAYYYIRKLAKIGAIREVGTKLVRGGTARLYQASGPSFGIEMDWGETSMPLVLSTDNSNSKILKFLEGYVDDGSFNGIMIVGAPNPHGQYKSSARDGHYAIHLAFFLGKKTNSIPLEFIVKLDVDAKAEKMISGKNLISIGGPGTNIITSEFNRYLPIQFDEKNYWAGLIEKSTGKRYGLDNHGLIAKIKNPYDNKSNIIIVAGVRSAGTKSAVIALTNYSEEVLKRYNCEEEWALIVQGFDMNSDGKMDYIDIISGLTR